MLVHVCCYLSGCSPKLSIGEVCNMYPCIDCRSVCLGKELTFAELS